MKTKELKNLMNSMNDDDDILITMTHKVAGLEIEVDYDFFMKVGNNYHDSPKRFLLYTREIRSKVMREATK